MPLAGLSVGEPKEEMRRILDHMVPACRRTGPVTCGVGTPEDLVEAVQRCPASTCSTA